MNKINLLAYETALASCQSVRPLTELFSKSVKLTLNFELSLQEICIDTEVCRGQ
jgi:hypothetical protein